MVSPVVPAPDEGKTYRLLALTGAISTPCALVLGLWATRTNGSWIHWLDAVGSLAFTLATVGLGWWISGRFTQDPSRRGLVALVAGIWSPATGSLRLVLTATVHDVFRSGWLVPTFWTLWCIVACWAAIRTKRQLEAAARFTAIAGTVLLGGQIIEVWPQRAPQVQDESQPLPAAATDRPNIYLLVMDKMTNGAWLKYSYGVDISPYEDSLRALGFVVPSSVRANYAHTHLSLASFLNWRYLDASVDGEGGLPWGQTQNLVRASRTWSAARENGYRVVTFPNWYPTTSRVDSAFVLTRQIKPTPSRFGETWMINSPIAGIVEATCIGRNCGRRFLPFPHESFAELDWKLQTFASMADSAGPSLTFLHLLLPHEPYLFGEGCTQAEPWWPKSDQDEAAAIDAAYGIQARCTMPLILRTVREILRREKIPPVIIVQGDHGHGRVFVDVHSALTLNVSEMSAERLGDRMSVFGAYYVPGNADGFSDSMSMVNVLRTVARTVWSDSTPALPDSVYYSSYQSGFSFSRVRLTSLDTSSVRRRRGPRVD